MINSFSGDEMQKGFAMLEIILATMIIAVLMKVAVPNAAQIIDAAALDYETKRLYSEMRFLQTKGKINSFSAAGADNISIPGYGVYTPPSLEINSDKKSYQISYGATPNTLVNRERHFLSNGVTIDSPDTIIRFDKEGNANITSDHLTLTSRLGKEKKIIFDSVGRIRGGE